MVGWLIVFTATFNNISVISWRSVLFVEETGGSCENHWPVTSNWQTLSHNVVSSTLRLNGVRTHNGLRKEQGTLQTLYPLWFGSKFTYYNLTPTSIAMSCSIRQLETRWVVLDRAIGSVTSVPLQCTKHNTQITNNDENYSKYDCFGTINVEQFY